MRRSYEPPFSQGALALAIAMVGSALSAGPVQAHPIGHEFLVNTTTDDAQEDPDVAMDAVGNFVVVFENHIVNAGNANVSAQRYDATGQPLGQEFLVNTTQSSGNTDPAVAMDDDGDFVVVWHDFGDDGSGYGIFGQRYNAAGQAQGGNIPVNTTTNDAQRRADVAMDDDGDFVVVWEDQQFGDDLKRSIKAQRFSAAGAFLGGEIDVSDDEEVDQVFPKVAMDAAGNFVVGWAAGDVGANQDVVFQRFDAAGVRLGDVTQVNTTSRMDHASGGTNNMSIGAADDGDFVVAWRADNFSGPGTVGASLGILARRYAGDGTALGDAFEVNGDSSPDSPEVVVNGAGDFVVVYEAPDGSLSGPVIQRYYSNGLPRGPQFQINEFTELTQDKPALALDDSGNGIVAWTSVSPLDGSSDGIVARRLSGAGVGIETDYNRDARADIAFRNADIGRNHVWLVDGASVLTKSNIEPYPPRWQIVGSADLDRDGAADLIWRNIDNGGVRGWLMDGLDRLADEKIGSRNLLWQIVGVGDFNKDGKADLLWRHQSSLLALWTLDGLALKASGPIDTAGRPWRVEGVDDFDADGRSDILFRNEVDGRNRIWFMKGINRTARVVEPVANLTWEIVGTGDLDGDGFADIVWRNQNAGVTMLWLMEGEVRREQKKLSIPNSSWRIVAVRDFDGDGNADLLFEQEGTGILRVWRMQGLTRIGNDGLGPPGPGLRPVILE